MIGMKLGEFALTRTFYGHGADKNRKNRFFLILRGKK